MIARGRQASLALSESAHGQDQAPRRQERLQRHLRERVRYEQSLLLSKHGVDKRPVYGIPRRPRVPRGWQGPLNLRSIHGMRTSHSCRETWNRDFAAAINIWDAFYYDQVLGVGRPSRLLIALIVCRQDCGPAYVDTWSGAQEGPRGT